MLLEISQAWPFVQLCSEDNMLKGMRLVEDLKKRRAKVPISVLWRFPSPGFVRFNADGSSRRNPKPAGGGGGIRDSSG